MANTKLTPETATLEQVIVECSRIAKSFAELWETESKWILKLRDLAGYKQGSRGTQFKMDGKLIYFDEYVTEYLHTTTDNIRKLVQRENTPTAPRPDVDKPLFKKGFQAGQKAAETKLIANGHNVSEKAQPKPVLGDVQKEVITTMALETNVSKHAVAARETFEALTQDTGWTSTDMRLFVSELQTLVGKMNGKKETTRFQNRIEDETPKTLKISQEIPMTMASA